MVKLKDGIKKLFIVDIDGCICKYVFNFVPFTKTEDELDFEELIVRCYNNPLFEGFISFYETFIKNSEHKIIFLTGRKEGIFGEVTRHQLKILGVNFEIIFFPKDIESLEKTYILFKMENVISLYNEYKDHMIYFIDDDELLYQIFKSMEDKCTYCPIKKRLKSLHINNSQAWINLLNHLKKKGDGQVQ